MLLLPEVVACPLDSTVSFANAMVFGAVTPTSLISVGGATEPGAQPPSFRVDLGTGAITTMTFGMKTPRVRAAFAVLGDREHGTGDRERRCSGSWRFRGGKRGDL